MDIKAISTAYGIVAPAAPKASSAGFGDALKRALDGVNASQQKAEGLTREFQMENPNVGLEETMVAVTKANVE
ncbi:MAG: flagellar hook-basal body complex protein FliE, partial [Variovorax sp.]